MELYLAAMRRDGTEIENDPWLSVGKRLHATRSNPLSILEIRVAVILSTIFKHFDTKVFRARCRNVFKLEVPDTVGYNSERLVILMKFPISTFELVVLIWYSNRSCHSPWVFTEKKQCT